MGKKRESKRKRSYKDESEEEEVTDDNPQSLEHENDGNDSREEEEKSSDEEEEDSEDCSVDNDLAQKQHDDSSEEEEENSSGDKMEAVDDAKQEQKEESSSEEEEEEDSSKKEMEDTANAQERNRENDDEDEKDSSAQNDNQENEKSPENNDKSHKTKKKQKKQLSEAEKYNAELAKRGVLYIARIPPRMTPCKIRHLLSDFDEILRIYLVPEEASDRKRRKRAGGFGRGVRYTEGWVEFKHKRICKRVARELNCTPITNKKRDVHYGDLWNVKYLPKFQWSHLTEKVAYENRVRAHKLRLEMFQARKENANYVRMLEKGKRMDMIEEKRRKKGRKDVEIPVKARKFHQYKPLRDDDRTAKKPVLSSLL